MHMIPIDNIVVGKRLRQIRQESVDVLVQSIRDVGQLNPILVTPTPENEGTFLLVAGNHRLEACKRLGMTEIAVSIATGSDVDQRLAEIDENLCRAELTHLEKAEHLAERKALYEMKHPEVRHGGSPGMAGGGKKTRKEGISSFAQDTARKTRKTGRNIQQAVRRANNISQEIRDAIRDVASIADNSLELDALASLEEPEQKAAVQAVLDGKTRSIREFLRQTGKPSHPPVIQSSHADEERNDAVEMAASPTADLLVEIEEWKRRALKAEEEYIHLDHQVSEPALFGAPGSVLHSLMDQLENDLQNSPEDFRSETLDLFENRFMDLVFLIKNVKRRIKQ